MANTRFLLPSSGWLGAIKTDIKDNSEWTIQIDKMPFLKFEQINPGHWQNKTAIMDLSDIAGKLSIISNENLNYIEITFQKDEQEKQFIWNTKNNHFYWDSRWLGFIPDNIIVPSESSESLSLNYHYAQSYTPPLAEPGIIQTDTTEMESSFLLYRWDLEPSILIFDFSNYEIQAAFLKRLAFFIEKPGYRGTLLSNEELQGKHGWNAHDYSAESLADFFNKAFENDFTLNPEEEMLKTILLQNGILIENHANKDLKAGSGALISISRESSDLLRRRFFTHEAVHGLFFVNQDFQKKCFEYWEQLPEETRQAWKTFLYYNDNPYDSESIWLSVTELTAYMLQSPIEDQENYFIYRFQRVASSEPEAEEILLNFLRNNPGIFTAISQDFERLLQEYYSLSAGDFASVYER